MAWTVCKKRIDCLVVSLESLFRYSLANPRLNKFFEWVHIFLGHNSWFRDVLFAKLIRITTVNLSLDKKLKNLFALSLLVPLP